MNALLNWLDHRHHRVILLYGIFTLSAWWIMKNQIAFAFPLTKAVTITDLTIMSELKNATVVTRWAAIYLDHGLQFNLLFSAIHLEDWIFLMFGSLFCFKLKGYTIALWVRIVMVSELFLNGLLGYTVIFSTQSVDTLAILNHVKLFAEFELILSIALMALLFIYFLICCFREYSD